MDLEKSDKFTIISQLVRLALTIIENNNFEESILSDLVLENVMKYIILFKVNNPFYKMNKISLGIASFDKTLS